MSKSTTIRFAVGSPEKPFSDVWRLVASKNDVYLGASKESMGIFKMSLHESGVWVVAGTAQSGATFKDGNRRAQQWSRPPQHAPGITRGPSILVPHTSVGSRDFEVKERKKTYWHPAPKKGQLVEFSLYFIAPGAKLVYADNLTPVDGVELKNGGAVALLVQTDQAPANYLATCEKLLRDNQFGNNPNQTKSKNSFLWFSQNPDEIKVPMVTDLPVNFGQRQSLKDAIHKSLFKQPTK